jgi:hypothetical protein
VGNAAARQYPCEIWLALGGILAQAVVFVHRRDGHMDPLAAGRVPCPLICPCRGKPWAGCLVLEGARQSCGRSLGSDRRKRVAHGSSGASRIAAPLASSNGRAVTERRCHERRTASGGRVSGVCGRQDTQPRQTVCACVVRRASTSRMGEPKPRRKMARRSAAAEAANRARLAADPRALKISTWSCHQHYWT